MHRLRGAGDAGQPVVHGVGAGFAGPHAAEAAYGAGDADDRVDQCAYMRVVVCALVQRVKRRLAFAQQCVAHKTRALPRQLVEYGQVVSLGEHRVGLVEFRNRVANAANEFLRRRLGDHG